MHRLPVGAPGRPAVILWLIEGLMAAGTGGLVWAAGRRPDPKVKRKKGRKRK